MSGLALVRAEPMVSPLVLLATAPSVLAFALFGIDKARATARRGRRVPERRLLLCAALGGTPGAYAARWLLRHKTRKQPFVRHLHLIAAGQAALAGLAVARGWIG